MGWFILLYFVVGLVALMAWGIIFAKRMLSKYSSNMFEKALTCSIDDTSAEQSNIPLMIRLIAYVIIWPYILAVSVPRYEEVVKSKCEELRTGIMQNDEEP